MPVMVMVFGGFGVCLVLAVAAFFLSPFIGSEIVLAIFASFILTGVNLLSSFLRKKGQELFEEIDYTDGGFMDS